MKNRYLLVVLSLLLCGGTAFSQAVSPTQENTNTPAPRVLASGAMSEQDAALLAASQAAIVRAAKAYGYDLGNGSWTTSQAVCSAAPAYLIVQMSQGDDAARSFFTVLIPRNKGFVRIVPVLRQGTMNSWMFGEEKLQREFLDQAIPVDVHAAVSDGPKWTNLAGCYAALEGAEITGSAASNSVVVREGAKGKVLDIAFVGIQPNGLRARWLIEYDPHGKILNMEVVTSMNGRAVPQGQAPREKAVASSQPQKWKQVPSN